MLGAMEPGSRPDVCIHVPRQRTWSPKVEHIRIVEANWAHTQLWEQAVLPHAAWSGVVISLCNLGPVFHPRTILLVHDAQFLFSDSSYPLRQKLGYKVLIPTVTRSARRTLTVSQYSKQILDLTGVADKARTTVLYNAADHIRETEPAPGVLERFALSPLRYVVMFGSTKGYKNVRVVLEAFTRTSLAELSLVIVGEGESELREAGLRPPANAVFTGAIDDATLRALYEQAACLVFPSRTEGFGLPPLECMSLGCPVVVAPAGAIPEVCRDAVLYADVDDPDEWARSIAALQADPQLRSQKIAAGLARASEFTWTRSGERLLAIALELARE